MHHVFARIATGGGTRKCSNLAARRLIGPLCHQSAFEEFASGNEVVGEGAAVRQHLQAP